MKWLLREIDAERQRAKDALAAFAENPGDESLHDVRTSCRRLRSLLEDVVDCVPRDGLLDRTKRVAKWTDSSRDAAIMRALLERTVEESERPAAAQLFQALDRREAVAGKRARKKLARLDLS